MAYHHELLEQANELARKSNPNQADLRRSVSSAYYAVFHLLVFETIRHWSLDSSRNALGRMFDHSSMKRASNRLSDKRLFPFNETIWSPNDAISIVLLASQAFELWKVIGNEKIVQDYLVSLLIRPRD